MALIDVQRAMLAVCFRAEVPAAALAALAGERDTWLSYRQMVRERLLREIRVALPRSRKLLGDEVLDGLFVRYLDCDPPRTRFFREIVASFVDSALPWLQADSRLPVVAHDLVRYEAAVWAVSDLDARERETYADFAFDRPAVLSRALRLLHVSHAVHTASDESGQHAAADYWLGIHRKCDGDAPRTWSFNATTFALLERVQRERLPVADAVRQVTAERGIEVDAAFVDRLCGSIAQLIEAGIVLGSR